MTDAPTYVFFQLIRLNWCQQCTFLWTRLMIMMISLKIVDKFNYIVGWSMWVKSNEPYWRPPMTVDTLPAINDYREFAFTRPAPSQDLSFSISYNQNKNLNPLVWFLSLTCNQSYIWLLSGFCLASVGLLSSFCHIFSGICQTFVVLLLYF